MTKKGTVRATKKTYCLALCLLAGSQSMALASERLTLNIALEKARGEFESLRIQESKANESISHTRFILGQVFPSLQVVGATTRVDRPDQSFASFQDTQNSLRLNVSQPLFQGFREFAAYRASSQNEQIQKLLEDYAQLVLKRNVTLTFLRTAAAKRDLENLSELFILTEKRVKEVRERVSLGKSRKSELLSVTSQTFSLGAQIQAAQLELKKYSLELARFIGQETPVDVEEPKLDVPLKVPPLNELIQKLAARADLKAFSAQAESVEEEINIAKSAHWPTIEFGANYYLKRPVGQYETSKWDFGLTLTLPLFQGGSTTARVSEVREQKIQKELIHQREWKDAQTELIKLCQDFEFNQSQIKLLNEGFLVSEKNYLEQIKEYRLGISTNLEVNQSLNSLQEFRRNLDKVRYALLMSWLSIKLSTGI